MPADEKSKYKGKKGAPVRATEAFIRPSKQEVSAYNCNGISIREIERKKNEQHLAKQRMELTIEDILLTAMDKNQLDTHEFFFMSVSYFLKKSNGEIWPCEMAMAQFNIKDGLLDTFTTMINPEKTPIGYASEVINFSKETHQLSVEDVMNGENDFAKLFDKVANFIGFTDYTTKAIPPIYTGLATRDIDAVMATLDKMAEAKGYDFNAFRVYPIESLLFKLQKKCITIHQNLKLDMEIINEIGSIVSAKHSFERDDFTFCEIGCQWHNEQDKSQYCCLSMVKRWAYTFAKYCVNNRFPLVAGQHYPETYQRAEEICLTDSESVILSESMRRLQIQTTSDSDTERDTASLVTRNSSRISDFSQSSWIKRLIKDQKKRM